MRVLILDIKETEGKPTSLKFVEQLEQTTVLHKGGPREGRNTKCFSPQLVAEYRNNNMAGVYTDSGRE